ncbi:protocatechuate 3,4-dioxygenase [Duganella sp. Leaf126]|uniref:protocatechuate 3,4-dioxygenase n=1 Tax=Duganella sp. Leaf126 TaxID=1736266 RepID=UPI0006F24EA6|nr:protocatechuate 3,4-dioxygenase [Duganella sp. Leaf126]KQQ40142.1 protocatechuate 3,4-dioxygenase [Duganella sp. Leaf126]
MTTPITTAQTIGPFSHEAWQWAADLGKAANAGSAAAGGITISGTIYDGDGVPINDAQIETWQPGAAGVERALDMPAFRRIPSDEQGGFAFTLADIDMAAEPGQPVAYVTVFARGLVKHQFTAVFLADDAGLEKSAILAQVPAARRPTLLAAKTADGQYRWDIRMQGPQETAFFDYI